MKLDPRRMVRNPVMFVVEVGSLLTTILWIQALVGTRRSPSRVYRGDRSLVVVYCAVCQFLRGAGRRAWQSPGGSAAADPQRNPGQETQQRLRKVIRPNMRLVHPPLCTRMISFWSKPAISSPRMAKSIEGIASVDESAVTGESAPVIRESGGDRSAVTGGTRLLSDWLVVRVTANPGEGFLDRMISLVEGAKRQKTPNEIALNILLAAFTIIFLVVCATLLPYSLYSVSVSRSGDAYHHHSVDGFAGLPDPHHHRRICSPPSASPGWTA